MNSITIDSFVVLKHSRDLYLGKVISIDVVGGKFSMTLQADRHSWFTESGTYNSMTLDEWDLATKAEIFSFREK